MFYCFKDVGFVNGVIVSFCSLYGEMNAVLSNKLLVSRTAFYVPISMTDKTKRNNVTC